MSRILPPIEKMLYSIFLCVLFNHFAFPLLLLCFFVHPVVFNRKISSFVCALVRKFKGINIYSFSPQFSLQEIPKLLTQDMFLHGWQQRTLFIHVGFVSPFKHFSSLALFLLPWRLRRHVPPKRRLILNPHGAKAQKTAFFTVLIYFNSCVARCIPLPNGVSGTHILLFSFSLFMSPPPFFRYLHDFLFFHPHGWHDPVSMATAWVWRNGVA
jgi:hypothetical protein